MLADTQRLFLERVFFVRTLKHSAKFLNHSDKAIRYLFKPEDSSEKEGEGKPQVVKYNRNDIPGTLKAIFWILISISISSLIGRLC